MASHVGQSQSCLENRLLLRRKVDPGFRPNNTLVKFDTAQIAQGAQIDLVTIVVRGRGALDLAIFGSTTYRVMQLGPCPVFTAHV